MSRKFPELFNFKTYSDYLAEQAQLLLQEGLSKTYPRPTLNSWLFQNFSKKRIRTMPDNSGFSLKVYPTPPPFTKEEMETFQQVSDACGYHVGIQNDYGFRLEPKYPILIDRDELPDYVYHVTRKSNLRRILDPKVGIGLAPKNSKTKYKHPGNRIYLFIAHNLEDVLAVKESMRQEFIETAGNPPVTPDHIVPVVLKVRLTEPMYYLDPNMQKGNFSETSFAILTLRNIPKRCIELTDL